MKARIKQTKDEEHREHTEHSYHSCFLCVYFRSLSTAMNVMKACSGKKERTKTKEKQKQEWNEKEPN